ncbi:MAG: prohibitin family protein [Sarcina sp.]
MGKGKVVGALAGVVVLGAVGVSCIEKIPAGYVGGMYSPSTGVKEEILTNGWHFVSPMVTVSKYSVATEQLFMSKDEREGSKEDDSFTAICKDGSLGVDFEMSYNFDNDSIPMLMQKYRGASGQDIVETKVRGKIKTYVNEVTSKYSVLDAHLEKKSELNADIQKHLSEKLKDYGIIVETASLSATRPDAKLASAIAERSEASQKLEKIKLEKDIAEQEAQKQVIQAQGKADALLIEAQGKADANKKLEQSLTPEILKQQAIEAWKSGGSNVPQVVGGNAITNLK